MVIDAATDVTSSRIACLSLRSPFDQYATAEDVTKDSNLVGKTAVLTGSNSGIGFETLRVLVLRGAHVLAFARNLETAEQACALAMSSDAKGTATPVACDLTDYDSVVSAATAVRALGTSVDMLICNAGINAPVLEQVNGIEKHFAVHHLSHFILVNRLLNLVTDALQGRVVVVGSIMYKDVGPLGIEFENLAGECGEYDMFRAYGQSKLANGLFTHELARRLRGSTATANVLHPGAIPTNINRTWIHDGRIDEKYKARMEAGLERVSRILPPGPFIKSISQGAATTCYVATHPGLARVSGAYFEDCNIVEPGGYMQDDAMASKLWAVSENLTEQYLLPN